MNNDERVTYFAETDARNKRVKFGIKAKDRSRHMYIIGKTGMGKSTLLENMAVQDIQNGEGIAFVDPHGKTADLLLEYVPEHRIKDVVYFAPFDLSHPVSFNVLEDVDPDKRHLVVSGLMSTFKKIWVDAWSARMEYILSNTLLALLEYPEATLLGVNRMLSDKDYRKKVVDNVKDPSVRSFWVDEFAKYTERMAAEAIPAIQNKVGQFTSNPLIRNLIGQPKSSFNLRQCMDSKKILIVNLSKGRIGDTNANLIGGMMITKLYLAAMSRADVSDTAIKKLPYCYLFVDEFQNFANESFADILSEARKYKLSLTIAHQYIEQMEEEVRAAVFGNVGTMITFRVGAYDAEVLEKEFGPAFTAEDIVNLGFAQIYLKLMIDGVSSQPFSAVTLGPIAKPEISYAKDVIDESRAQFAQPRDVVEKAINEWHKPTVPAPQPKPASPGTPVQNTSKPAVKSVSQPTAPISPKQNNIQPQRSPVQAPRPVEQVQVEKAKAVVTDLPKTNPSGTQSASVTASSPSSTPSTSSISTVSKSSSSPAQVEQFKSTPPVVPEIKPISLSSLVSGNSVRNNEVRNSNIEHVTHTVNKDASNVNSHSQHSQLNTQPQVQAQTQSQNQNQAHTSTNTHAHTHAHSHMHSHGTNHTNHANSAGLVNLGGHHSVVNNKKQASVQNISELKKALQALTGTSLQNNTKPAIPDSPQEKVEKVPSANVMNNVVVQSDVVKPSSNNVQEPKSNMGGAKGINEQDLIDLFKVE